MERKKKSSWTEVERDLKDTCTSRPNFFVRSRRIRVDLLSYESKTTDERQQNDWRAKKNLDGVGTTIMGSNEAYLAAEIK